MRAYKLYICGILVTDSPGISPNPDSPTHCSLHTVPTEPPLKMTTVELPVSDAAGKYDYVVVGGGTAGCVLAARLAEYLPHKNILLIEAGPSDFNDDRVLNLREWLNMLGGEFDYDYGTTEQPMGKTRPDTSDS